MPGFKRHSDKYELLFLLSLVTLVLFLYYPALNSQYYLDDYYNLYPLTQIGEHGYLSYIFSGVSSELGRPLSLLTFALQYQAWPENAFAFKFVNLMIHLFNGFLLYKILQYLSALLNLDNKNKNLLVIFAATIWLIHPIQISTVLYTIQRMTLLSATFTLGGILFYLNRVSHNKLCDTKRNFLINGSVVYLFTLLAILCKENGILLPLFIFIISIVFIKEIKRNSPGFAWHLIFLGLPLLILSGYLAINFESIVKSYHYRPYSLVERLYTEANILIEYLGIIILPKIGVFSLYHDDYPVATSILSPPVTFLSVILVLSLFLAALINRKYNVFRFAVLWFLGGHLLESTILNLELYFEHRNYLPSMGVIYLITYLIIKSKIYIRGFIVNSFMVLYLIMCVFITKIETSLWTQPLLQAITWYEIHPGSVRAINNLSTAFIKAGHVDRALENYIDMGEHYPDDIYPDLKIITLKSCILNREIDKSTWKNLYEKADKITIDNFKILTELKLIIESRFDGDCHTISFDDLKILLFTLASNQNLREYWDDYYDFLSLISLNRGDINKALSFIREANNLRPEIRREIYMLEIMINHGMDKDAIALYNKVQEKINKKVKNKLVYSKQLAEIESRINILTN